MRRKMIRSIERHGGNYMTNSRFFKILFRIHISQIEKLQILINECNDHNIQFIYASSPGLDITYSSVDEIQLLNAKYAQLVSLGCRSFSLLFDDIASQMSER